MIRGNGALFGSIRGIYYNPQPVFPYVPTDGTSAISPDINNDTTPTADIEGTPETGDLVFAHLIAAGPAGNAVFTPSAGEGFSSLATAWDQTSADTRSQLFVKRWGEGGGQIDNVTVVFTSSLPNARLVLVRVKEASLTDLPVAAAMAGSGNVSSGTLFAPTVVVPDKGLLMHFYQVASNGISVTADVDQIYGGASYLGTVGPDVALAADASAAISGSAPAFVGTASTSPVVNGWNAISIAFAGQSSTPVVESISAISSNVSSANVTNTIAGATPNAGDIIVFHLVNSSSMDPAFTPPVTEGWSTSTNLKAHTTTAADSTNQIFWKRWGEPGQIDSTTVNFTGAGGNSRGVLIRISGCRTAGDPFDAVGTGKQSDSSGDSSSIVCPSLSVPDNVSLVMRFYACSASFAIQINAPMLEKYEGSSYSFTNGFNGAVACSTQFMPLAGTAAPRTGSTSIPTGSGNVGITVAVPPRLAYGP